MTSAAKFESFADYYQHDHPSFLKQRTKGGSFEIEMFKADQAPSEMIDPPVGQFSIVGQLSKIATGEFDIGYGWGAKTRIGRNFVGTHPAYQECGFRIYNQVELLVASASQKIVQAQLERIGIYTDPFLNSHSQFKHNPHSMLLLRNLWLAIEHRDSSNDLLIDGYFIALMGQMLSEKPDKHAFAIVPDLAKPQLARVIDYIETHFDVPLLTSELAAIAAMSTAQFGRSFKAATGFSPHHYVTIRRIAHAKRMLQEESLTMTQIAFCCGFSSAAHFATTFQQHMGQPPSAYRSALN
jgi:AraC-like DNA-binding protein